jgi:hypothetical protein
LENAHIGLATGDHDLLLVEACKVVPDDPLLREIEEVLFEHLGCSA